MANRFSHRPLTGLAVVVWIACFLKASLALSQDFVDQIAPILQQHCIRCHSDNNAEGELSFSSLSSFTAAQVVVPGSASESRLIAAVTPAEDGHAEMPKEAPPLNESERMLLVDWIKAGANWPAEIRIEERVVSNLDWWSLRPIPVDGTWSHNTTQESDSHPVDHFINEKLRTHGLSATAAASPEVQLRRLTYDLSGLPPTPEELIEFQAAYRQEPERAWQAAVDRRLSSPAFGEKWAQHWLDLSRYAETHGYDKDKMRPNAWPYRDYVIHSFNQDKPIDRFVQEQIAGDRLFPNDPDGIAALGFLAAGPWDYIGHVEVGEGKLDGRIAKHLDRDEMLAAVFNIFMSTTIQCAQCHHHKFDPIRIEDYYRGQAVFAGVDRADRPYRGLAPQEQLELDQLKQRLNVIEAERKAWLQPLSDQLQKTSDHAEQAIDDLLTKHAIQPAPAYGYHSQIETQAEIEKWVQLDLHQPISLGKVRLIPAFDHFANIGRGFGFPVRYRVAVSNDPSFADGGQVLLDATQTDQLNPKSRIVEVSADQITARYVRVTCTKLAKRQGDYIFALSELELLSPQGQIVSHTATVTSLDSIEAPVRWARQNLVDGVYWQADWPPDRLAHLITHEQQLSTAEQAVFTTDVLAQQQRYQQQIAELQRQIDAYPPAELVYAVATEFRGDGQFQPTHGNMRNVFLLHRGDLRNPGAPMLPGVPPLWSQADELFEVSAGDSDSAGDEGAARACFARYVTDRNNPLFWRSMANRLWQWTMGQPLVATPNDFGRMGSLPTHPELLDYLAARLRDDPQHSVQSIVRLLVTSQTYRRSSMNHEANRQIDAGNQYYWRANRRKLSAEEFRDSMLAVAGKLPQQDEGGPSFQDFIVDKPAHSPHYEYELSDPNDPKTYRRSIYRFVVRSQPQPMLTALDCADPTISVPQRDESTTALQALTQWNDRLVETFSAHFASRLQNDLRAGSVLERPESNQQKVQRACLLALGRLPDAEEEKQLLSLLQQHGAEVLARVIFNMSAFNYVE